MRGNGRTLFGDHAARRACGASQARRRIHPKAMPVISRRLKNTRSGCTRRGTRPKRCGGRCRTPRCGSSRPAARRMQEVSLSEVSRDNATDLSEVVGATSLRKISISTCAFYAATEQRDNSDVRGRLLRKCRRILLFDLSRRRCTTGLTSAAETSAAPERMRSQARTTASFCRGFDQRLLTIRRCLLTIRRYRIVIDRSRRQPSPVAIL